MCISCVVCVCFVFFFCCYFFFFQAEDGIRYLVRSRGLGDVYKRQNIGWLSVENAWDLLDYKLELKTSANVFQGGTLNTFGIYAFNSSLKLFKDFGFNEIQTEVISNTKYFISKLNDIGLKCILSDHLENEFAGIVTINSKNPEKVVDQLKTKKIICSLREGFIRFAPHFYNTHQDIDSVVEELRKL